MAKKGIRLGAIALTSAAILGPEGSQLLLPPRHRPTIVPP